MSDWSRAGPWTLRTAGGLVFALLGAGLAGLLGYAVAVLDWPLVIGAVGWAVLALWTVYWWRVLRSGVFTSDDAIRVRTVPRTRTFPAAEVAEVRVRSRSIAGGPLPIRVREVCFDLGDGRTVSTAIHGDAREGRGLFRRNVLSAPVFDLVLDRLRRHVAEAEPVPQSEPGAPRPEPSSEPPPSGPGRRPPPGIIEWK